MIDLAFAVLWKSTCLIVVAWMIVSISRRASASTRHAVWSLTLGGLLILPAAEWLMPRVELPLLGAGRPRASRIVASGQGEGERPPAVSLAPRSGPTSGRIDVTALPGTVVSGETVGVSPPVVQTRSAAFRILAVWALGVLAVWVRIFAGVWRVRNVKRRARPAGADWASMARELRAAMSVCSEVEIRIGGDGLPPMTWGLRRHTILLPAGAERWSGERRRVVLAHELAHIRRRDGLVHLLAQAVLGLYWFHPLVWYAAHRLRIDQEQASDDYVLGLETSPADYAEHLLGITRGLAARTSLAAVTMAEGSGLEARLQAILDPSLRRGAVSALSAAFAALVVSLVLVSATGIRLTEAAELTASEVAFEGTAPVLPPTTGFQAEGAAAAPGRVTGRVIDGVTGDPVQGARVFLVPAAGEGETDSAGRFVIEGVPPRNYSLGATRAGYLGVEGARMPGESTVAVTVGAGADLDRVLRLYPAATVEGRLFDSQGRPAQGIFVRPFRWTYDVFGEPEAVFFGETETNDLGEFRFDLDTGDYGFRIFREELEFGEPAVPLFRPFYYPGTPERSRAEFVAVSAEAETRLDDLVLPTAQGTGRLRIFVVDEAGQPLTGRHPVYIAVAGEEDYFRSRGAVALDGTPIDSGLLPWGRYEVEALGNFPERGGFGLQTVDLFDQEADVVVRVLENNFATVRAVLRGADGSSSLVPNVLLRAVFPFRASSARALATISARTLGTGPEGSYLWRAVQRNGRHRFGIEEVPDGLYPIGFMYEGRDILADGIRFERREMVDLDLILGSPAAGVVGVVTDPAGRGVPGARVALLPDDRSRAHMYVATMADSDGEFAFRSVAPGDYHLYSWTGLPGEAWRNAAFMQAWDALGLPLRAVGGDEVELAVEALDLLDGRN